MSRIVPIPVLLVAMALPNPVAATPGSGSSDPVAVDDVQVRTADPNSEGAERMPGSWEDPKSVDEGRILGGEERSAGSTCPADGWCWYEGGVDAGQTYNCVNSYNESLGRSWVGWRGNLDSNPTKPQVGQVYYTKIGWGVSGWPCGSGGAYVHVELYLPVNTQLAISSQNPVQCFYESSERPRTNYTNDSICPQSPSNGQQGGLSFSPKTGDYTYPTPTGGIWEIFIPVKTTAPVTSGYSSTGACPACIGAAVWMIDGNYSPWSYPRTGVYVDGQGNMPPSVSYPVPSVTNIQYSPDETNWPGKPTTARTTAYVSTAGTSGQGWFEIGKTKDYGVTGQAANIGNGTWEYFQDWRMQAGETWHWRFCYKPTGKATICGADQTFQTAPAPDTTPPRTTFTKKPPRWTNKTTAVFEFDSNELDVQFWCDLTWFYRCASRTERLTGLAEGEHTFEVYAEDAAGNSGYDHRATWTWNIDLTKPQTTLDSGPTGKTRARKATFGFSSNEPGTFLCSLDGSRFRKCSSGKTYERLSTGKHVFKVRAKDRATNLDGTPAVREWRVIS